MKFRLECPMCFEEQSKSNRLEVFQPCGHIGHFSCLQEWQKCLTELAEEKHRSAPLLSCPLCRQELKEELEEPYVAHAWLQPVCDILGEAQQLEEDLKQAKTRLEQVAHQFSHAKSDTDRARDEARRARLESRVAREAAQAYKKEAEQARSELEACKTQLERSEVDAAEWQQESEEALKQLEFWQDWSQRDSLIVSRVKALFAGPHSLVSHLRGLLNGLETLGPGLEDALDDGLPRLVTSPYKFHGHGSADPNLSEPALEAPALGVSPASRGKRKMPYGQEDTMLVAQKRRKLDQGFGMQESLQANWGDVTALGSNGVHDQRTAAHLRTLHPEPASGGEDNPIDLTGIL